MRKFALFAFNGELMCFVHLLLNALDMKARGYEVKIVLEGAATKLIPDLVKKENSMASIYQQAKDFGLFDGACKACYIKMGVFDTVQSEGIPLLSEMSGHPSMARYREEGFEIITF